MYSTSSSKATNKLDKLRTPVEEALHYSSPAISISKFKEQCHEKIDPTDLITFSGGEEAIEEKLTTLIGVDAETIQDLQEVCNIDNLEV